jgi:Protease subunit of ATP-dependent Clp proteases
MCDCIWNSDQCSVTQFQEVKKSKKRKLNETSLSFNEYENSIFRVGTEIFFTTDINKNSIQEIMKHIKEIIHEDQKIKSDQKIESSKEKLEIAYVVDSPGGSVSSVLKFYDFLQIIRNKFDYITFVSIISGTVASAGTIMAIAADKRYITNNASAMIHELSAGNNGKYTQIKGYTKHLDNLHDTLVKIYCSKTPKSKEEIEKLLSEETWFSAESYLENGFVDKIIGK